MPLKFVVNDLCKPFAYDNFVVVFLVCSFFNVIVIAISRKQEVLSRVCLQYSILNRKVDNV